MTVKQDITLKEFEFWAGGKDWARWFTDDEMDTIEHYLEDVYPDGIDETTLNELFWFEPDWLASLVGFEDADELLETRKNI